MREDRVFVIRGFGASPRPVRELDPGNGGLVLRLLLAFGLFLPEVTYLNSYPDSLGKRPQDDLLAALRALGAEVTDRNGRLPITVRGGRSLARHGEQSPGGEFPVCHRPFVRRTPPGRVDDPDLAARHPRPGHHTGDGGRESRRWPVG